MNVLIIGSGGREHALAQVINRSKRLNKLYAIPGNPGIAEFATCINIDPLDNECIKNFALSNDISLIIPGSEQYLENGISDYFKNTNVLVFGPSKKASQIETSKEFAKKIMKKYDIPTAEYQIFNQYNEAKKYVLTKGAPLVIKYDGLAGGKGVVVSLTINEALDALKTMLVDKKYGNSNVIIEDYLEGEEFSLISFVNKSQVIPMPIAKDHKRLLDNDCGPNTGGMGVYSPVPSIPKNEVLFAIDAIVKKTIKAFQSEKIDYIGFLYAGLILTKNGPKVIEFNARLGDPEAEVILPKLESDFIEIIMSLFEEKDILVTWNKKFNLGVVLASKGYPGKYQLSYQIEGLKDIKSNLYHMGTSKESHSLLTNGGRVLLVCGEGLTLEDARQKAYNNLNKIKCENLIFRSDIGNILNRGKVNG